MSDAPTTLKVGDVVRYVVLDIHRKKPENQPRHLTENQQYLVLVPTARWCVYIIDDAGRYDVYSGEYFELVE